jgi:hypothetical protein
VPYDKDGNYMSLDAAIDVFLLVAFDELVRTAKVYNAVITYKELAQKVKEATGIRYDAQLYWLGRLLGPLVARCAKEGLPPLTSLVVHAEGTVGAGYREVLEVAGEPVPDDLDVLDDHAALARLECYKFFGAELPPGGGKPTLTPRAKAARDYKRAQAKRDEPPKVCPTCFTVLPATGICDNCA